MGPSGRIAVCYAGGSRLIAVAGLGGAVEPKRNWACAPYCCTGMSAVVECGRTTMMATCREVPKMCHLFLLNLAWNKSPMTRRKSKSDLGFGADRFKKTFQFNVDTGLGFMRRNIGRVNQTSGWLGL